MGIGSNCPTSPERRTFSTSLASSPAPKPVINKRPITTVRPTRFALPNCFLLAPNFRPNRDACAFESAARMDLRRGPDPGPCRDGGEYIEVSLGVGFRRQHLAFNTHLRSQNRVHCRKIMTLESGNHPEGRGVSAVGCGAVWPSGVRARPLPRPAQRSSWMARCTISNRGSTSSTSRHENATRRSCLPVAMRPTPCSSNR